jgi:hypothetical protein
MDCKTARQFLDFARPRRPELDAAELEELEAHLADCPDCGPLAQVERQIDSRLGQAMQAVPVPDGLRNRLLTQLESERAKQTRKWRRWLAVPAAAAALLLATWIGWKLLEKPLQLDIYRVADEHYGKSMNPRPEMVEDYFRDKGIRIVAPLDANYVFLREYWVDVDNFQGKRVPKLWFTDGKSDTFVYILSVKEFDVAAAPPETVGSGWRAVVRPDQSGKYAYLVIYLGDPPLKIFPDKEEQPGA